MIRTERLLLRPWRDDDLEPFAALNADPVVMEHFPSLLDRAQTEAAIGRIRAHFDRHRAPLTGRCDRHRAPLTGRCDRHRAPLTGRCDREGFGLWAVEIPGVAPFIGFTGLARPAFMPDDIEIGWRLARAHWGAGYATEAARAVVAYAFDTLGLDALISMTVPSNLRSQHVMKKLGFVRDPDGDFEHPNVPAGNAMRPHWLFRLRRPR